mmetsp:Transcript_7737/g.20114  ORF Transcript_7737/g.20114 Transcript_7737/m.20114 type:complete len:281 (-) Transcript_7737:1934-2776(-)
MPSPNLHPITGGLTRHPLSPKSPEVQRNRYHSTIGDTSYIFFAPSFDRLTEAERRRLFRDEYLVPMTPNSPAGRLSQRYVRAIPREVAREAVEDCRLAGFVRQNEVERRQLLLKEKGWDDRSPVVETGIPFYDSLSDPHLPKAWRVKAVRSIVGAESSPRRPRSMPTSHSSRAAQNRKMAQFTPPSNAEEVAGLADRVVGEEERKEVLNVRNQQRPFLAEYGSPASVLKKSSVNQRSIPLVDDVTISEPVTTRLKFYPTKADRSWVSTNRKSPKRNGGSK